MSVSTKTRTQAGSVRTSSACHLKMTKLFKPENTFYPFVKLSFPAFFFPSSSISFSYDSSQNRLNMSIRKSTMVKYNVPAASQHTVHYTMAVYLN